MHVQSRTLPAPSAALEPRLALVAVVLFALLVRLTVIAATVGFHVPAVNEPASDSRIHAALVANLLAGRGYSLDGARPTAITPPLYVLLLAGLYRVFDSPGAVRLVQAGLGAAGALLLYGVGQRLFDHRTGMVAACALGLQPLISYLSGLHLTENLFLLLILAMVRQSVNVAHRPTARSALGLGALAGLAALTRAVFLSFLPMVVIWALSIWGVRTRRAYGMAAIALAAAVAIILPWSVRNYLAFREIIPIQSNFGMIFWAGNNASADGGMVLPTRKTWTGTAPPDDGLYGWRDLSTAQANGRYVGAALSWIRGHPGDFSGLLGKKLNRLYGFARATDEQGLKVPPAVMIFQVGLYAAAMIGVVVSLPRWRALSLLLGLIAFTNASVLLFSGATRYVVPMMPSLLLFGAATITWMWDWLFPREQDA